MARAYELSDSRSVDITTTNPTTRRRWIILGAADEVAADVALIAAAPASVLGLPALGRSLSPQGGAVWFATVTYGPLESAPLEGQGDPAQPPAGTPETPSETDPLTAEFSFDTTGQAVHITQSLETRSKAAVAGQQAPDYRRAIGVSKEGVAGCDIDSAKLQFSLRKTVAFVTLAYVKTLRDLTNTTNDRPMWGFERGELRYLGSPGSYKGGEVGWPITFNFLAGKNRAEVVIVPGLLPEDPPILKATDVRGHDYVWVGYEDAVDQQSLIQRPRFVYVERVYEEGDFRLLGLGGA